MLCPRCNRAYSESDACTPQFAMELEGGKFRRIVYGSEDPILAGRRCASCNVTRGSFHHQGCALEQCPRCKGRLLACHCEKPKDREVA